MAELWAREIDARHPSVEHPDFPPRASGGAMRELLGRSKGDTPERRGAAVRRGADENVWSGKLRAEPALLLMREHIHLGLQARTPRATAATFRVFELLSQDFGQLRCDFGHFGLAGSGRYRATLEPCLPDIGRCRAISGEFDRAWFIPPNLDRWTLQSGCPN